MKKLLLSVSLCAAALFAGCTRDIANNGDEQNGNGLKISGIIEGKTTRVVLGDVDKTSTSTEILWEFEDMIGVFSTTYTDPAMEKPLVTHKNDQCMALTETNSTVTNFMPLAGKNSLNPNNIPGVSYWAYYPKGSATSKDAVSSPLKKVQSYNKETGEFSGKMFMATSETTADKNNNISFKFRNTFAMVHVALNGNAKIDSIEVGGFTKLVACDNAFLDITKAPAVGTNAADFMASGFFKRAEGDNAEILSVRFKFPATLRLNPENALNVPIMILPTEYNAAEGITLKIFATDKNGSVSTLVKHFGKNTTGIIKTNDIIYLNPEPISAEELNQNPPRTSYEPGVTIFEDNFSWITDIMDTPPSEEDLLSPLNFRGVRSGIQYFKSGWSPYEYYDDISQTNYTSSLNAQDHSSEFSEKYIVDNNSYTTYGLYGNNGMVYLGGDMMQMNGYLTVPIDLEDATADLKVTFKAAKGVNNLGESLAPQKTFDIVVDGPGSIKGGSAQKPTYDNRELATITPASQFQFTEYTVIVTGATSETKIQIGSSVNTDTYEYGGFIVDDINIVTAASDDDNDFTGKVVARPAATLTGVSPEDGKVNIGWNVNSRASFEFTMTGKWEMTGVPDWLIVTPQWAYTGWGTPEQNITADKVGNDANSIMLMWTKEANPSTTPRTATITLISTENGGITKTFTITQAAQPEKRTVFATGFGRVQGENPIPLTQGMNFGATVGENLIIKNFDAEGKNTKGELTNLTAILNYCFETFTDEDIEKGDGFFIMPASYTNHTTGSERDTEQGFYNFKNITTYSPYDDVVKLGFGVKVPVNIAAGDTQIIVNFGMFLGFDPATNYDNSNYINIFTHSGYNEIKQEDLKQYWNYYTKIIPIPEGTNDSVDIWIYPPTDKKQSRANSVLLDDIKIEVQ